MWPDYHEPWDGDNNADAIPPFDPLIHYGYMYTYPRNAFLNDGEGVSTIIRWTAPSPCELGDGDPRFGYNGEIMGNTLEDPLYLWDGPNSPTRIKNCFLEEAADYHVEMISYRTPANPFYSMGGLPEWQRFAGDTNQGSAISNLNSGVTLNAYWPGEFFYRSGGSYLFPQSFLLDSLPNPQLRTIWDFHYTRIDRYFLGGYGSMRTDGFDLIRLTQVDGRASDNRMGHQGGGNYEEHPNYFRTATTPILFSSPEIFGGGERGRMPYFPYYDPTDESWTYGAPDGFRDGIIIALTSGTDKGGDW
jgi:hypothetical protein